MQVWRLSPRRAERRARDIVRELLVRAGIGAEAVADMELVIAELATNGVRHSRPPYELRVLFAGAERRPIWCELADADPCLGRVPDLLREPSQPPPGDDLDAVIDSLGLGGRGLSLVRGLTAGHCTTYTTPTCSRPGLGKAIGFALPCA
ncbi:ATP-binding protein [Spirillospora sp. NPDC029432]|uniref:ATP-binding protein n=1 Tax=Spirillospora sp. NPDC029432 TaxID=3154599 RepID=UPI003454D991